MKLQTHYLNTDLDLTAPLDLTPLADALAQRGLCVLHVQQWEDSSWSARFETEQGFEEADPNIAIMLTAVESLDEPSRNLWAACTLRNFNIGYECSNKSKEFHQQLSSAILVRMAALGAAVEITLYPMISREAANAAVQILKKDKIIKSHIGKFNGNGYRYNDSPSIEEVKVTLNGNKGYVNVQCVMELNKQEEWMLKEIKKVEKLNLPNT